MKKLILLMFVLISMNIVNADNQSNHDFKLQTIIDDKINVNTEINKFFKITYLNHTKGEKEQERVFVYYNITKDILLKEAIFNVTVNSYTTSKTGSYFFNETGNYTLWIYAKDIGSNEASANFTAYSRVVSNTKNFSLIGINITELRVRDLNSNNIIVSGLPHYATLYLKMLH